MVDRNDLGDRVGLVDNVAVDGEVVLGGRGGGELLLRLLEVRLKCVSLDEALILYLLKRLQ